MQARMWEEREGAVGRGDWSVAGDREARREVKAKPGHLTALFAWLLVLRPIILSNSATTANGQRVSGSAGSGRDETAMGKKHGRPCWGGAAAYRPPFGPTLVCPLLRAARPQCRKAELGSGVSCPPIPTTPPRITLSHTTAYPHCDLPSVHRSQPHDTRQSSVTCSPIEAYFCILQGVGHRPTCASAPE